MPPYSLDLWFPFVLKPLFGPVSICFWQQDYIYSPLPKGEKSSPIIELGVFAHNPIWVLKKQSNILCSLLHGDGIPSSRIHLIFWYRILCDFLLLLLTVFFILLYLCFLLSFCAIFLCSTPLRHACRSLESSDRHIWVLIRCAQILVEVDLGVVL